LPLLGRMSGCKVNELIRRKTSLALAFSIMTNAIIPYDKSHFYIPFIPI